MLNPSQIHLILANLSVNFTQTQKFGTILVVTMAKGKRGFKFTIRELKSLVKAVEELVPISNIEWEWVWNRHVALYPQQDRTAKSLKRKFQEMGRAKIKTGDPNMPPHICGAKWAYFAIVKKTDGSTGGGSDDSFF